MTGGNERGHSVISGIPAPTRTLRLRGTVADDACVIVLGEGTHVIGSDHHADLLVRSKAVSRRHASVLVVGNAVTVRDLGSKNGTFVNGRRVEDSRLEPGDWLQLGPARLLLEEVDADEAELAIRVDRPAEAAGSGTAMPDTENWPRAGEPAAWLPLLERLLPLLDEGRGGGAAEALDQLVQGLGAEGAALVEEHPGGHDVAVATAGRLPSTDVPIASGAAPWGYAATRAELSSRSGVHLALHIVGEFPRREDAGPLLRIFLHAARRWRDGALPVRSAALERPGSGRPSGHGTGQLAGNSPRRQSSHSPTSEQRSRRDQCELRYPDWAVRGRSAAFLEMERQLLWLARVELPVLVVGETGVGKELVARVLHLSSQRSRGPLVALNCAAIPAELLEADLFGVVRGAATGVVERRGALERASGGVLLLDEIGDMALPLQAKLLRALQEKEVLPVGAETSRPVDVRLVSLTNSDIHARIESGAFRRDLYYRVAGATLQVAPLRERRDDIPRFVDRFLRQCIEETGRHVRGITVKALAALVDGPWPGNIRELEHVVRLLVGLCPEGQAIDTGLLPEELRHIRPTTHPGPAGARRAASNAESGGAGTAGRQPPRERWPDVAQGDGADIPLDCQVDDLERRLITAALERAGGNQSLAARRLGLSRNGLAMKLRRLGLA